MAGAHPLSRRAFSYPASLGSSLDESGAEDSIEEAGSDDVVAVLMLCTAGVAAGMGVLAGPWSPVKLLGEPITELIRLVDVDAAGTDVELQATTPTKTRAAPAMIGRSPRIGGV